METRRTRSQSNPLCHAGTETAATTSPALAGDAVVPPTAATSNRNDMLESLPAANAIDHHHEPGTPNEPGMAQAMGPSSPAHTSPPAKRMRKAVKRRCELDLLRNSEREDHNSLVLSPLCPPPPTSPTPGSPPPSLQMQSQPPLTLSPLPTIGLPSPAATSTTISLPTPPLPPATPDLLALTVPPLPPALPSPLTRTTFQRDWDLCHDCRMRYHDKMYIHCYFCNIKKYKQYE